MRNTHPALVLAGRLEAIPLADVIQVLAAAGHDGVLTVENEDPEEQGEIEFEGGRVVRAEIIQRQERLGTILVRRAQLDPALLGEALRRQTRGAYAPKPLGTVLLEMGAVEPAALASALVEQIGEHAAAMLSWNRGVFRFRVAAPRTRTGAKPVATPVGVAIEPRELLLEAARRLDEGV